MSADGDFQVTASGRLDLETYIPGADEPWIIPETEPFVAHRLRVFTDVFVGERLYGLMEVRTDRGEEPRAGSPELRLDQAFLRVTSDGGRLSFQAGKFASPFGGYARRHHTEADPLIRPPFPYEWRTMACDWRVPPDAASFATWKDDPEEFRGPGAPPIWGVPYQWGVSGFASVGDVLLQLALMNSAPSSGPGQWGLEGTFDRRPSVVAALGWQATAGLHFDAYYDRGPYMEEEVVGPMPAGTAPEDPVQELFGVGLTYRRGRATVRWEGFADRWEVPNVPDDPRDFSYYFEGEYVIVPGLFLAGRWGEVRFDEIAVGPAPAGGYGSDAPRAAWDYDVGRLQLGAGYRLVRNAEVRVEWAHTRMDGPLEPDDDLLSVQLWWEF
ncbi:MAG: hypothetical protein GWM92_04545 [Gemmatimonadetes bacterium]|nr:hypothetical protein [Gemmatimonadota bacterium]NIV82033.1 hypothetical protein [Gemmatimonadota bacterium]NIY38735.1 hypothetical protein [Gemmatimonadota bacterium]